MKLFYTFLISFFLFFNPAHAIDDFNFDVTEAEISDDGNIFKGLKGGTATSREGLIINAGGYTHTSVAIHDALKILKIPIIELHISNIYNREEFRHKSLISKIAKGVICGFGANGYIMSLQAIVKILEK